MEWTNGIEHWTGLLDLFGQVSEFILEAWLLFYDLQVSGYYG